MRSTVSHGAEGRRRNRLQAAELPTPCLVTSCLAVNCTDAQHLRENPAQHEALHGAAPAPLFAFGELIPNEAERAAEREDLDARISVCPIRFDDVKRLNALDDLDGDWGCRPLRVLLYKLSKKGD